MPERAEKVLSRDLPVGTRVRYKPTGDIVVLARRKKAREAGNLPGWWIEPALGGGGLADVVIDEAKVWEVLDA
jgi:hypothetical protein